MMTKVCCYICGAKCVGGYGGYETFLDKLTEYHQDNENIQYYIACKKNGIGAMNEDKLTGVKRISEDEFIYHNAHCFKLYTPDIGSAQAILHDIRSLEYCIKDIKRRKVEHPIVYVLSSRIGPFMGHYAKVIHKLGGVFYHNPDGAEYARKKYNYLVRCYWKLSEQLMIKHADLIICDSKNIRKGILEKYKKYKPKTTFIAYGAEVRKSILSDDAKQYTDWMAEYALTSKNYYLIVGRFVPENNYETMIREFMHSKISKDLAIITNANGKFYQQLEQKLHFEQDKRIKFVGTVYDKELLMKIRENAYCYLHGHEVGGTNPSLLEALGSTDLNLIYDVGFNREVAEDAALYWRKEEGNLSDLIDSADDLTLSEIAEYADKARKRISDTYTWQFIADRYEKLFIESN